MMYKMEQGRLMEYHTSVDSTDATVLHEYASPNQTLSIVETRDGVLLFRMRLFNRVATVVVHTTFELLATLRYVRELGLLVNEA